MLISVWRRETQTSGLKLRTGSSTARSSQTWLVDGPRHIIMRYDSSYLAVLSMTHSIFSRRGSKAHKEFSVCRMTVAGKPRDPG